MLKSLIVPLDGSELAERAVPYAQAIAQRVGARIMLLRAVPAPSWSYEARIHVREEIQDARNEVAQLAREVGKRGSRIEWDVVEDDPAWAIINLADRSHADLIVMATHGRTGVARWLFGSVAERVLRHAPTPVLFVPAAARFDWPEADPFRLLVTLDGSALAESVLDPAVQLASTVHAEVMLVRAVGPISVAILNVPGAILPYDPAAEMAAARAYLEALVSRFPAGCQVKTRVAEGIPEEVIPEAARTFGAHTIAMATHGHGRLATAVVGSVAKSVLEATKMPTLLVRPAVAAERDDGGAGVAQRAGYDRAPSAARPNRSRRSTQ